MHKCSIFNAFLNKCPDQRLPRLKVIDIGLNNYQQVDDAAQTSAVSLAKGGYWDLDSVELKKESHVGELCRKLLRMYGNEYVAI